MLSKGLFLIFPLAASGLVLSGETIVPVKATPTVEPMFQLRLPCNSNRWRAMG